MVRWPRAPLRRRLNPWLGATDRRRSLWRRLTPAQLFVGSFAGLVLAGTLGLKLLPGLYTGAPLGWLDALFTATSAVCVTGLVVVDTATRFTIAGQAFLLLLIQLGGLGMIAFTTLIILALGRRLSLRQEGLAIGDLDVAPHVDLERLGRNVVLFTLGAEALGALALYLVWVPRFGWGDALWPAVFHAVSAFCNAGFSTFSDSLIGLRTDAPTLLVVAALLVAGGIGFLTMEELRMRHRARQAHRGFRLSLHSRLALATTGILLGAGWLLFALLEGDGLLRGLSTADRLVNALFMSATPRTAGFNNVDYAHAKDSTNYLTIILMFAGGSPGSTAGGLKTTTVAVIAALAWSRMRGREVATVRDRSLPEETVQRAVGLAVAMFVIESLGIFLYTVTEERTALAALPLRNRFLAYMFEAVSAFNTVGLSMGVTGALSTAGKWLTVILMFVGRVGPLTFAAALALAAGRGGARFRYAYEDVVVG